MNDDRIVLVNIDGRSLIRRFVSARLSKAFTQRSRPPSTSGTSGDHLVYEDDEA